MVLICPNCGKINEVKEKKLNKPSLRVRCRYCGYETTVQVGTTSHSPGTYTYESSGRRDMPAPPPAKGTMRPPEVPGREEAGDREVVVPSRAKVLKFLLMGLVVLVLLTAGMLAATLFMIRGSPAYKAAESYIRASEEIRAVVGENPSFGLFPAGSIRTSQGRGTADFLIDVTGSRGKTEVRMTLNRENDRWKVVSVVFTDRSGKLKRLTGESSRGSVGMQ
jgi:DNA-directed RNA polymerase subunit RPC12/RpoP